MNNSNKIYIWHRIREFIYLILLFGYLWLNLYNSSWMHLSDIIPRFDELTLFSETVIIPALLAILYLLNLIFSHNDRNILLVVQQILIVAAFAVVSIEHPDLLPLGLFIICAHFSSFKKIAVVSSFVIAVTTLAVIIASQYGWTVDMTVKRFKNTATAHYFGFGHYAIWARQLLFAAAAYLYSRGKKVTVVEIGLLAVLNYIVYYFSTQRLTYYTGMIMLIVFLVFVKFEIIRINNKFITFLSTAAFPVTFAFSVALHYFYDKSVPVMAKLNKLLSTRLQLGKQAFEMFDIKLFAQQVHEITDFYFYIDCGYLYLLFAKGIVLTIIVMFMYSYIYRYSCKTNNTALFAWITVALIYLIVDNTATNINCTAIVLLAYFICFKENSKNKSIIDKDS